MSALVPASRSRAAAVLVSGQPVEAPRLGAPLDASADEVGNPDAARARPSGAPPASLRRSVADCLGALERLVEEHLAPALELSSHAWDRVDGAFAVLDRAPFADALREARRRLGEAAVSDAVAARAVAVEGLLALELAVELTRLFERRLASLIRLRALSGPGGVAGLLPEGRPFLDLARALRDAARAWS